MGDSKHVFCEVLRNTGLNVLHKVLNPKILTSVAAKIECLTNQPYGYDTCRNPRPRPSKIRGSATK